MLSKKSLPVPVEIRVGESLQGFFYRASEINHYQPKGVLLSYIRQDLREHFNDRIERPVYPASYSLMSRRIRHKPIEVFRATVNTYSGILNFPGTEICEIALPPNGSAVSLIDSKTAARHVFTQSQTRYCPYCVGEDQYHQLAWLLVGITMCVQHNCLLLGRCQQCGINTKIRDVVYSTCRECGFDLSKAKPLSLDDDELSLAAQQNIQSWFGLCEPSYHGGYIAIPGSAPRGLYQFIYRLQIILRGQKGLRYLHRVGSVPNLSRIPKHLPKTKTDTAVYHSLFCTAFKSLLNWPEGFYELLDTYRNRPRDIWHNPGGLLGDFGVIYTWLQRVHAVSEFNFLQEAFNDFLVDRYSLHFGIRRSARCRQNPAILDRFHYITYADAIRILNVTGRTITLLSRMGRIRIVSSANGKHPMLYREDIATLRKAWSETLSTDKVCSRLGISQSTLSQLIKIELIRAERGPEIDGCQQWRINERQVEACLINIRENTSILPLDEMPESTVDLTTAAKMMAVIGGNASMVIQEVVYGSLVGYTDKPTPIVCDLYFEPSEIKDCINNLREAQGWLTREQIASIFRVKVTVVSRWINRGLIEPAAVFGSMHYFDKKAVYRFRSTHVFTEEAARILGIGVLAVQKWARKGRLTPIAGGEVDEGHRYLFKRSEVERLSKALTHPRLCRYLWIRRQQLDQLIDNGIIKPISGPGVDEMGHYLFEKPSTELFNKLADMGIVERY